QRRHHVVADEHEVAAGERALGAVGAVALAVGHQLHRRRLDRAVGVLDEVAHGVAVGVRDQPVGLAGVEDAVAALVLFAVGEAVVGAVGVLEVGRAVAVGVDGRGPGIAVAGLGRVGHAVAVRIEVAPVADEVAVGVDHAFLDVADGVAVGIGVAEVG